MASIKRTWLFGIILLVVTCSRRSQTVAEEEFYLTVVPLGSSAADGSTEARSSGSGDVVTMDGGSGEVSQSTGENETETCTLGPEVSVRCSCGGQLWEARDSYQKMVESSCERYDELNDSSSSLSFCNGALRDLLPGYEIGRTSADNVTMLLPLNQESDGSFTNSSLAEKIKEMEREIALFRIILDRTITGVLVDTNTSKCPCLDHYKRWLCVTQLPIFVNTSSSYHDDCISPDTNCSSDTSVLCPLKPCITVCHKVLQKCPYYTPSPFQVPRPEAADMGGGAMGDGNVNEVIYGGYPAFDCPRNNSDISTENSTYAFRCSENCSLCIDTNRNDAQVHVSSTTATMFSILLFIFIIRTIT